MTIKEAIIMQTLNTTHTISIHGVRKFQINWTLCLLTTWNYMEHLGNFDYFLGL